MMFFELIQCKLSHQFSAKPLQCTANDLHEFQECTSSQLPHECAAKSLRDSSCDAGYPYQLVHAKYSVPFHDLRRVA